MISKHHLKSQWSNHCWYILQSNTFNGAATKKILKEIFYKKMSLKNSGTLKQNVTKPPSFKCFSSNFFLKIFFLDLLKSYNIE